MKPARKLSRRSFFVQVAGGAVAIGALGIVSGRARAQLIAPPEYDIGANGENVDGDAGQRQPEQPSGQGPPYTGITDEDYGTYSDAGGHGRGPGGNRSRVVGPRTGHTDGDASDAPEHGRGGWTGRSDHDTGPNADASGYGHGAWTGVSDADMGVDPPGRGRSRGEIFYTGRTDSDGADQEGYGRGTTVRAGRARDDGLCVRYTGQTDADQGPSRDPVEYGNGGNPDANAYEPTEYGC